MATTVDASSLRFDGSNWEDLDRIIARARFHFLQEDDFEDNDRRQSAYLSLAFTGPALDWAGQVHTANPAIMDDFNGFVQSLKEAFGVEANNITALRRKALDDLHWTSDVPVFFAEFDRLTLQLGISGHPTKIAMVLAKLPVSVRSLLATQALDFHNYDTMRERLNTMWALDPNRGGGSNSARPQKRPRCGTCGKKGHTAQTCRGASKN